MRLKRRTILVVDDNPGMIDLLRRYLVGQPYQIVGVYEAKQAIQFARKSQPNVVLLDVMLPGQDGWEVLQNLKNHPTTRHIPVIICSVLDALEWAYSLGADGYLRKPPGQAAMLDELARWAD
jgi:CheY-like chemotaxis protein